MQLLLLAAHMIGDFWTQNNWMSANKFKDWRVRTVHVCVYTMGFVPIVAIANVMGHLPHPLWFLGLLFGMHWITDCRRWASGEKWPPKPILVDQALHVTQLALLSFLFK